MATLKAIPGGQGGAVTSSVEPYGLVPEYERALLYMCCSNRDVYARIGVHLDPKAIVDKTGVQLLKAAQAIAADVGEGPTNPLAAIQRLRQWREEGKVTIEQVQAANEYLDAAEDAGLPSPEEVIAEMAHILKKRARREKAKKVLDAVAKGGDLTKIGQEMVATERIGENRATLGEMLHDDVLTNIVASAALSKFPTGCLELDNILGGGLPKGFTLFLGREKSGKSMVLSSIAAEAVWRGKNVAFATLELDTHKQLSRMLANLLCCTIDEVETGQPIVKNRLAMVKPQFGKMACQKFSPDVPVSELIRWMERLEEAWSAKVDLLVVDYIDLVGAGKSSTDEHAYLAQKVVINALRDHAIANGYVVVSASQAKRGTGSENKPLDIDDAADSQHKIRIPDLVMLMRMMIDRKGEVDWYVGVKRDGEDRVGTGSLPTFRSLGRMFPVNREEPW